jgi:hypothetical protein
MKKSTHGDGILGALGLSGLSGEGTIATDIVAGIVVTDALSEQE